MEPSLTMLTTILNCLFLLCLLARFSLSHSLQEKEKEYLNPFSAASHCNETCGELHIPIPFYLNSSCRSISVAFRLSCLNFSELVLNIGSVSYPVLEFFPDGVLVDFPGQSSRRQYNDLNKFGKDISGIGYYGISIDNVIGLYDCEDSSPCKADCETIDLPDNDGNEMGSPTCCYPLSDHSTWHLGNGFSEFSKFGCRGFSSWVVLRGKNVGKRGVKFEWAIPKNSSSGVCAKNADMINATTIESGFRCDCQNGYVGDGFANGTGCLKSCLKDGQEAYGRDCNIKRYDERKLVILAGILGPAFVVASLTALFCLLKGPEKSGKFDPDNPHFQYHSVDSFQKASKTRLFSHHELKEAIKGFDEGKKIVQGNTGTMYAGVLGDGSPIAVYKLRCENEKHLLQVLSQMEVISTISHPNMARLLGCCIDSSSDYLLALVVYEYPASSGTLEEYLHQSKGQKVPLDWYKRLNIAAETASVLAFLQHEISPPVFHCNLKCGYIFLDEEFTSKIAGIGLTIDSNFGDGSHWHNSQCVHKTDVYDMGVVLLDIISGSNHLVQPTVEVQKIRSGKLEEIIDPLLYYHEQPGAIREQIEIVADLATRCMLFGKSRKLGMVDVARELVQIAKEMSIDGASRRGPALEETFSNSSLLQMISMSPDSIYVP